MWPPALSPWRGILIVVAFLTVMRDAPAQNDAWTGGSANLPANLWTDPTNWDTGVPGSSNTAYFNTSTPVMSVSLGGTTQTPGGIQFDTSSVAAYTIGSSTSDGMLQLATAGTSSLGAIAVTSTVTTAQVINSPISFPSITAPFITNQGATGSSLTLANVTTPSGTTTTIVTGVSAATGSNSITNLGSVALPASGQLTLTINGSTTSTNTPFGTLIGQGVISGGVAGAGTTTSFSVVLNGGGSQAGTSNGSAPPTTPTTLNAPVYQPNVGNTYSGGTDLASGVSYINITGNSVGSVNADGTTNVTSGPFGTGTIFITNAATTRIRPVGGSWVIYNGITEVASGFTMGSAVAGDTNSITFAGPIVSAPATTRFISNGYSIDENTTTPVYGATMILGLAANPSTINTPTTTAGTTSIVAINGPIIINDVIQSPGATTSQSINFNNQNQDFYSIRINSQNTYNGSTFLGNSSYANQGAILVGSSSVLSGSTIVSGPFSSGTVYPANGTNPTPTLVPVGADQTIANAFVIGNTSGATTNGSGFTASNYWLNTIDLHGTVSQFVNSDPTGNHNLFLTGPITEATSRTVTNYMAVGAALYFGTSANPSTYNLGTNSVTFGATPVQTQPAGYVVGGLTIINDVISGTGTGTAALNVNNGAVVQLNNANTYSQVTNVATTAASNPPGAALYAMNGTNGSATGTGAVNVYGYGGGVGTGGILGGTGTITGPIAISTAAAATQGGVVYPGIGGANAGTLTVGTMQWNSYGRYVFAYNPTDTTTGGTANSFISGTGTLDLSNLASTSPFDLNLQPLVAAFGSGPLSYTIASFAGGITGTVSGVPTQPIANGTDVSSLFTLSGSFLGAAAPYAMVVAGVGGGTAQAIQLTFSPGPSQFTWTGTTSGSWNGATTNWSPAAIPMNSANNQLTFGATPNPAMTNDISGGLTLNLMTFNSSSPVYTLGGNTLTFATSSSGVLPSIVSNSSNSVTLSVPLTLTNNLTVSGSGNVALGGAISGAGALTMSGTGTLSLTNSGNNFSGGVNVLSGTVQVAADADLGTGNVTGATLGTLSFTGSTATTKSFAMNGGTITVASGQTVTFNGSQLTSVTLDGTGTFATNGAIISNGNSTASVAISSNSASDRFVHFTNNAALTFAGGLNPSLSTAVANLNGFINQGSGSVTIGAGSAINAANFQSYGTLTLTPNTTSAPTVFTNTGSATLGFDGGSRTFIGTPGTADPTGQNIVDYVDLHGHNAVVTDALFVNNGGIYDTVGAGSSTVIADYGSLVKGAGFYQNTVKTQNGGKFQTGNSPGSATFGNFVFGPGGVSNYIFAIDDATGTAGPSPGSSGLVSGWGLIKAVQVSLGAGTTSGNFTWTATPTNTLSVAIDTLVNPTMVGTDVAGPMADFDPTQAYSWTAARWTGTYAGPTDAAMLDADTSFNTTGFANPIAGTFAWSLDPAGQTLSLVYTPSSVPEPGSLTLIGLAAAAGWWRRRRIAPSA